MLLAWEDGRSRAFGLALRRDFDLISKNETSVLLIKLLLSGEGAIATFAVIPEGVRLFFYP
jgi:hypothetical protein